MMRWRPIRLSILVIVTLGIWFLMSLGTLWLGNNRKVEAQSVSSLVKPSPTIPTVSTATSALTSTPTPTFIFVPIHDSNSSNPWIVPIIVAIITGGIALFLGIYQPWRSTRLQHEKQVTQHRDSQEILRLQKEIDEQYKAQERQRERQEMEAEAAVIAMQQARTTKARARAYRAALHSDPRIAGLQILDMSHPLEVTNVYVQVRLHQETKASFELDPALLAAEAQRDPNALLKASGMRLEKLASIAIDPGEAIRKYKRCVIVGDPGAGKTTLLKYLTLKSADRQLPGLPDLPIHIELNAFAHSGYQDLLDYISARWDDRYGFPKAEAHNFIERNLRSGNALLLLDALDETVIGEASDLAEASYERVANTILQLATRYHQSPVVITARKAGYHQRARLAGFTELEVLDFRPQDIQEFVYNWFYSYSNPRMQAKAADLDIKLQRNSRIRALASNPLLLSLIVIVYEAQLDLPDRRAELYKQCVDTLLTKWDASRLIHRRREFKPEHQRQLLEEVAWHFHNHGQRYFPERELLTLIASFLPAVGLPAEQNRQVLEEIAAENGLLKEQARDWHGFLHLTLQEYFVAQYVTDHNQLEALLMHQGDPWWEEVILLYAGLAPDISPFLQKLIGEGDEVLVKEDIFHTGLILAGRCLAARPTVRKVYLRKIITTRLFDTLLKTPYALTQRQIASALAEIGGDVNTNLLQLLSDPQVNPSVRSSISKALGDLGEKSVAAKLLPLISNSQIEPDVRISLAEALGSLGEQSVAPDLLRLLADSQIELDVRTSIAEALGSLGERSVVPELLRLLSDSQLNPGVRKSVVYALGSLGERSVASELLQQFVDSQVTQPRSRRRYRPSSSRIWYRPSTGKNVIELLGSLGERSVVPELLRLLSDSRISSYRRREIAEALGSLGEQSVVPELLQLFSDSQVELDVRISIASTLVKLGERSVVPDMLRLLSDSQVELDVRMSIAAALGSLGEQSVVPELLQLFSDSQVELVVRISIASTLIKLGERSVVLDMLRLLSDPQIDQEVRKSIAAALGNLGERSVVPELLRLLSESQLNPEVRESVVYALGSLGERSVASELLQQSIDSQVAHPPRRIGYVRFRRRSVIELLGSLGERSVVPELLRLLSDLRISSYRRREIAEALGSLEEQSVVPELLRLLSDSRVDLEVRQSIADVLEKWADENAIIYQLTILLQKPDITNYIYSKLWTASHRTGVRVFITNEQANEHIEIVKW